jgi:hypothetical protein
MAAADTHGTRYLTEADVKEVVRATLRELGLGDENAANDIRDLRNLIDGWRQMRRGALQTIGRWICIAILAGGAWAYGKWGFGGHP